MLSEIRQVYQDSRKARDIAWNVYVARPLAAVLVAILRRTSLTPNQVTILGFLVFLLVVPVGLFVPGPVGFLAMVALVQLAYIFDCADGQLARLKHMTSPAGAYFDFFIDEVKALLLVALMGIRLFVEEGRPDWLVVALLGAIMVSVATSLTAFIRRPEYSGVDVKPGASAAQPSAPNGFLPKILWIVQRTASYIVHYPSWILYVGLLDLHPEVSGAKIFLGLFLAVYTLYIGKTGLSVLVKLGSSKFYKN